MSECGCHSVPTHAGQRRILWIALGLNAAMALVETLAGLHAQSTGLLADALAMLSDAGAYAIALAAIGVYVIKEAFEILREARDAVATRAVNTICGSGGGQ